MSKDFSDWYHSGVVKWYKRRYVFLLKLIQHFVQWIVLSALYRSSLIWHYITDYISINHAKQFHVSLSCYILIFAGDVNQYLFYVYCSTAKSYHDISSLTSNNIIWLATNRLVSTAIGTWIYRVDGVGSTISSRRVNRHSCTQQLENTFVTTIRGIVC